MSNEFSLEEKYSSDKEDTYTTPRNAMRNKGFQPYKETTGTMAKDEEYQGIVEKLKYEMCSF